MNSLSITVDAIIAAHEASIRSNPKRAIRLVMWLSIHDEASNTETRDCLEKIGVLSKPISDVDHRSQKRKVDNWRTKAERSIGLPNRGTRGGSDAYRRALYKWQAMNPYPSNEQLRAGWVPQPLSMTYIDTPPPTPIPDHPAAVPVVFTKVEETKAPRPATGKSIQRTKGTAVTAVPTEPQSLATAPFADPKNPTAVELRALSRKTQEDSRQPTKPKPTAPIPPKFNGPQPPVNGTKATAEENAEFKAANLEAKEKYIAQIEKNPNWQMTNKWNERGDPDDYIEYIGPPWE